MANVCIPQLIFPEWQAPEGVGAISTTRLGGVSQGDWHSLNLATHVGDRRLDVVENRKILSNLAQLPSEPIWLQQVHGCETINADNPEKYDCDASMTRDAGVVCAVMTADCLPLLMTDRLGTVVAAVHAGWKGLAAGVIESTLERMDCDPEQVLVWLGPAIGPHAFEVGDDVYQDFVDHDPSAQSAFTARDESHWLCDLYQLARQRLNAFGVTAISGGDLCTYSDAERFFSYRRDGVTGRMASMIWIK